MVTRAFTRETVRRLEILGRYDVFLASMEDRASSTNADYLSHAASFVFTLGEEEGISWVTDGLERRALERAEKGEWQELWRYRDSSITATVLTVTPDEVRKTLKALVRSRTPMGVATHVSAVALFFRWLESKGIAQKNHFEVIRRDLKFSAGRIVNSIDNAGR